jgi:cobalt-zinc-cadmium efflux system membrane fusion protein
MKLHWFFISLIAVAALAGCGAAADQKTENLPPSQPATLAVYLAADAKGVQTITVATQQIPDYLEIPGKVAPDPTRVVHVFPATGGRVVEMRVRPWDRVSKGQTLAIIESSEASRALSDYLKARTDAELKKKSLERSNDLFAHHAIAEKDLQQAQADSQSADAEMKAAVDQLHLMGVDPAGSNDQLKVLAPRSGVILDVGAASGEFSKSLDAPQPLCTIADLDTVWIEGEIFEKDVKGLRPGEAAEITLSAYPGEKWSGRISVVGDAVDPATRTLKVRVELANPKLRLKPDMFATVRLLRSTSQGLLIPTAAVDREGQAAFVFVGTGNNKFERRSVTLGRNFGQNIEVVSGLAPGAVIVSEGSVLMRGAAQN